MADLARAWLSSTGKGRAVLPVRVPGSLGADLREAPNSHPSTPTGRITFEEYLFERARLENHPAAQRLSAR